MLVRKTRFLPLVVDIERRMKRICITQFHMGGNIRWMLNYITIMSRVSNSITQKTSREG